MSGNPYARGFRELIVYQKAQSVVMELQMGRVGHPPPRRGGRCLTCRLLKSEA